MMFLLPTRLSNYVLYDLENRETYEINNNIQYSSS